MQVVVDKLLTNYEQSGEGKVVLLLHGWGDDAQTFKDLSAALTKNYRVLALNLPGFGGTQNPPSAWGLDDYSKFIASFLKKIEIKEPYAIIGHSSGGAISIRAIAKNILVAEKLVLLASAGVRGTYKGRVRLIRYVTKTGKALTTPLPASVKKKLRRQVYKTVGSDMLVAEHLQETFKKVVTDDVQTDAVQITIPTLLIYGEDDTATPVAFGEKLHELIEGSTLEVLPGAGHFVLHDRPAEVVKAIQEFLK